MSATWRFGFYKNCGADANTVYSELCSLGTSFKPDDVVEYARQHEDSELHKLFTWDDSIAAEKWRRHEARNIMCSIVFVKDEEKQIPSAVRTVVRVPEEQAYKPTKVVIQNRSEYESVLERAWDELRAFKRKYEAFSEFEEIFALIN